MTETQQPTGELVERTDYRRMSPAQRAAVLKQIRMDRNEVWQASTEGAKRNRRARETARKKLQKASRKINRGK